MLNKYIALFIRMLGDGMSKLSVLQRNQLIKQAWHCFCNRLHRGGIRQSLHTAVHTWLNSLNFGIFEFHRFIKNPNLITSEPWSNGSSRLYRFDPVRVKFFHILDGCHDYCTHDTSNLKKTLKV